MTFHSDFLVGIGVEITPCGSRMTCDPPPTNTDADYLVVVPPGGNIMQRVWTYLATEGFTREGSIRYAVNQATGEGFHSFRRGEVNLLVTQCLEFADRHKAATAECKRLNLMHKPDRVALFQWRLYGNDVTGVYAFDVGGV